MASVKDRLVIRDFKGLNEGRDKDLIETGESALVNGLIPSKGKLVQIPPYAVYNSSVSWPTDVKLFAKVYISDYLKAAFSGSFSGSYCYIVIHGVHQAMVVNPEDFTDTVNLQVVAQTDISATSLTEFKSEASTGTTSRYITGWRHDTLNEASGENELKFSFGVSGAGYAIFASLDNWATKVTGNSSATSDSGGSEFTITVNGVSTDLIGWWPGSLETGIVNEGFAGTRSYSYKIQSDSSGYERFTTGQINEIASWDEPCSFCYHGTDLIFSWYGRIYKFNGNSIVSLGDGPLYGSCVENFYNHIFVGQALRSWDFTAINDGPHVNLSESERLHTVMWSDVNNIDVFYAQQINEADTFVVEQDNPLDGNFPGVTALNKFNDRAYVFTERNVYEVSYVGLPLVMQVRNMYNVASCMLPNATARTPNGIVTLDVTKKLKLINGNNVTVLPDKADIELIDYDYFRLNSDITDFVDTYRDSRFPGYVHLCYNSYDHTVILYFYTFSGSTITPYKYNVTACNYILDLENGHWSKQRLPYSEALMQPYASLSVPSCPWVNAIGDQRVRLQILGGKLVGTFYADSSFFSITESSIILNSFVGTGVLNSNASEVAYTTGILPLGDPEYYQEIDYINVELSGENISNVYLTVYNFESLAETWNAVEQNTYSKAYSGSAAEVFKFNIRKRVRNAAISVSMGAATSDKQHKIEIKSITVVYNHRNKNVES